MQKLKLSGGVNLYKIFIWLVVFFWGMSFVATKVVVSYIPPATAALIRFLIALVFLIFVNRKFPKILNLHGFFAGFWGITMYFYFENAGLVHTFPTNASLIVSSAPILHILFSHIIQKKKATMMEYIASFIAFSGVAVVILNGKFALKINPVGDIMLFGAASVWVLYTYHVEKMPNSDSLEGVAAITFWGVVTLVPFSLVEKNSWVSFNPASFVSLMYLGVVCSGIAYVLWNKGIKKVGSRYTTNTIYFIPVLTSIAESIFLKRLPNLYTIFGGAMVLVGLWLFNFSRRRLVYENISEGEDE